MDLNRASRLSAQEHSTSGFHRVRGTSADLDQGVDLRIDECDQYREVVAEVTHRTMAWGWIIAARIVLGIATYTTAM